MRGCCDVGSLRFARCRLSGSLAPRAWWVVGFSCASRVVGCRLSALRALSSPDFAGYRRREAAITQITTMLASHAGGVREDSRWPRRRRCHRIASTCKGTPAGDPAGVRELLATMVPSGVLHAPLPGCKKICTGSGGNASGVATGYLHAPRWGAARSATNRQPSTRVAQPTVSRQRA